METSNLYETVIILNPKAKSLKTEIQKLEDMFKEYSHNAGKEIKFEDIGEKSLAYEIKGQKTGYYIVITWQGTDSNVTELERYLRINYNVLKFMTVHVKEDAAIEEDKFLNDYIIKKDTESEQKIIAQVDALDVILGFANYNN